jgi:hypothetical protein
MATTEPGNAARREGVEQALTEIVTRGNKNGRKLHRVARRWERLHYTLGGLAVVLATTSAITGLASATGRIPAAVIAAAAAAATGLTTFFASEKRSRTRDIEAAAWFELKDAAKDKLLFRLRDDDWLRSGAESDILALQRWQARLIRREIRDGGSQDAKSSWQTSPDG